MRKPSWIYAAGLALALIPAAASAQTGRVSLEGRGGMAFPTGDLERGGASSGFAGALDLMYTFSPWITGYAGVSRDEFDGDFSSSGFQVGGKAMPGVWGSMMPWVSLGLLGQKLNADGEDSDMEMGVEAGLGADFEVTPRFTLAPNVRYRTYDATIGSNDLTARYWVVSLGAHLHLR